MEAPEAEGLRDTIVCACASGDVTVDEAPEANSEANSGLAAAAGGMEEEDMHCCRVCHESSGILYHPCRCDGSIRFVHQDCLITWLKVSRQSQTESKCELCGSRFVFRSVYRHGGTDPPSLSMVEFVHGLFPKVTSFMHELLSISLMTFLWFFCLPIVIMCILELSGVLVWSKPLAELRFASSVAQLAAWWWNGLLTTLFVAFASASILQFLVACVTEFLRVQVQQQQEEAAERGRAAAAIVPGAAPEVGAGAGAGPAEMAAVDELQQQQQEGQQPEEEQQQEQEEEQQEQEEAQDEQEEQQQREVVVVEAAAEANAEGSSGDRGEPRAGGAKYDGGSSAAGADQASDASPLGPGEGVLPLPHARGEDALLEAEDPEELDAAAPAAPEAAPAPAPAPAPEPAPGDDAQADAEPAPLRPIHLNVNINMNDVAVLNGPVELTMERWFLVVVFMAAFLLCFYVVPVLVGRALLGFAGVPAGLETLCVRWISAQLQMNRQHADDLHVHFFGGPLPSSELTTEYIMPRLTALVAWTVGFGFLVGTAFVAVALYIVIWHRHTVTKIAEVVDGQARALWVTLRSWVVVSSVLMYDGGVLPQMLGWLIGIATLRVFDTSLQERLDQCTTIPVICAIAHWLAGVIFMMHLNVIVSELRSMIRQDLLQDFIPDLQPRDIEDLGLDQIANHPVGGLVRRALVNTCIYIPAVMFAVLVPARLGHLVSPCGRPLKLHFNEVMFDVQLPMEMLVFHILVPIVLEGMRHRTLVRACLEHFLRKGCCLLHIEDILEGQHGAAAAAVAPAAPAAAGAAAAAAGANDGGHAGGGLVGGALAGGGQRVRSPEDQWLHALLSRERYSDSAAVPGEAVEPGAPPASDSAEAEAEAEAERPVVGGRWSIDDVPYSARCVVLLLSGVLSLSLLSSWLVHVPLVVGKRLLVVMRLSIQHDLYSLAAGMCVCWALAASAQYVARDFLHNTDFQSLLRAALKWTWVGIKVLVLGALWLTVPPLLTGMLLEAIAVIPVKTPWAETPRYPLVQCWAVGLVMLKIWTRCLLMGALGDNIYRARIERVLQQGAAAIDAYYVFTSIICPISISLADMLIIPYFLARVAGALLTSSYALQTALIRFSFLAYFLLSLLVHAFSQLHRHLVVVYNEIRDSRYLVGTELTNTNNQAGGGSRPSAAVT